MAERLPSELSWKRALGTRRIVVDGEAGLAAASRAVPRVGRRRFLLAALAGALGTSVAASLGGLVSFLYPQGVTKSGGPIPAGKVADYPVGGAPVLNSSTGFFLVNLDPADTAKNGAGGGKGLLALARKCPHLGCSVPWNAGFVFENEQGWFRCPCHQSTYTKAGIRVFGPAPRPMDTMRVEIATDGTITVHSDEITRGSETNPARAVLPT